MSSVWYLGPGGMSGASIAGTMCRLEESGYPLKEDTIYAASCSSIIALAALTGQAHKGMPIYLEDVVGKNYLNMNPLRLAAKRNPEKLGKCMNTDYLMESVQRRIDVHRVQDLKNPLYIKLLNEDTNETEYLDARSEHILDILRAAVNYRPFNNDEVVIGGCRYSDAANKETIGLLGLLTREGFIEKNVSIDEISQLPLRDDPLYVLMGRPLRCMLEHREGRGYRLFMKRTLTTEQYQNAQLRAQEEITDIQAIQRIGEPITLLHPQNELVRAHTTDAELIDTFLHEGYVWGGALLRELELQRAA